MTSEFPSGNRTRIARSKTPGAKSGRRPYIARAISLLLLFAVIMIAVGLWLGSRALIIKDNLEATNTNLVAIETEVLAGPDKVSPASLAKLQDSSSAAKDAASDPFWKAAGMIPWVGSNFSAATEMAVSADDIVNRAVVPLLSDAGLINFDKFTPVNGAVNLDWLRAGEPKLTAAANVVHLSHERLARIDASALIHEIAEPLTAATSRLDTLDAALQASARTAQVLPSMMGADGPRRYLLLVQNNAEVRATGGIPGALAVLTIDNGKLTLDSQTSASALRAFSPPVSVDPDQTTIYSRRIGTYIQDVNLTPDFPTTAATAQAMWEKTKGERLDGVLSLDPVALAYILDATGAVRVESTSAASVGKGSLPTELTGRNVVRTLLSDVYAEIADPELQDAYFAGVAKEVFGALSAGKSDPKRLIESLGRGVDEGRILVWSAASNEQEVISDYKLGGSVTGSNISPAEFGVYFNDGTGAKMDYYVKRTVQLVEECTGSDYGQVKVRITSTNTAPTDAPTSLPAYVTGDGIFGVPAGTVQTNVIAYGPAQANAETAFVDGIKTDFAANRHGNRPVGSVTVSLAPGQSSTVELTFGKIVQHTEPNLVVTPTVQAVKDVVLATHQAKCVPEK
ncbi:DUF4012 domain-containing protein [Arthrobacter sp. Y81]|uniref:DUF4012 domain-containing protein n=1 Tax=Arthrobacter sp. Y81 TaxID=2058897 RepID=UPI002157978A|nr:DUF4012 domain-containing protein [Arthrobacter sp. Y81]